MFGLCIQEGGETHKASSQLNLQVLSDGKLRVESKKLHKRLSMHETVLAVSRIVRG
jgi:hypothetical protein